MGDLASRYDYFFEEVGRGVIRGANDARGEHFTGMALSNSIVRELIQNSLDAKADGADRVVVEFELKTVPTWDLPGIDTLRETAALAANQSEGYQGEDSLQEVIRSLSQGQINILRVGDYGTRGLQGTEENDNRSALTALVRGEGLSSNESGRGGSFGIGSSVGFVASAARTVAYTTVRDGDDSGVLFASSTRLASFIDEQGVQRDGTGILTDRSLRDTLSFPRGYGALSIFEERVVPGTDVYIYGYKNTQNDLDLRQIRDCVLDNFLVAIYRGRLVVKGMSPRGEWTLDQDSVARFAQANPEHKVYYRAISEGQTIEDDLPGLGKVSLHVTLDPDQGKPLPVLQMRSPLMKVGTYKPSMHFNFGAIFICDDPVGNKLLRNIEPPAHDRWNDRGPRSDATAVRRIRTFIRESLRELFADKVGDSTTISGIEHYLPLITKQSQNQSAASQVMSAVPQESDPTVSESPAYLGSNAQLKTATTRPKPFTATVSRPAISVQDGSEVGSRGHRGGTNKAKPKGNTGIDSKVEPGDGSSRLTLREVSFHAFKPANLGETILILQGKADRIGNLPLVGIASDGSEFDLSIRSAVASVDGVNQPLSVSGSTIDGVTVQKDGVTRLHVQFEHANRYRIGVKNGE